MSQELHYTSAPRGLKPGSRGFGTVAATAGLPDSLAERLESLSGYQAVYPPGDPAAALNPIVHAHVRLNVGGQVLDVVSRIGPAGLDYSGRPNKYAHHVVLGPDELPEGGPAWLLSQPGFLQETWEGPPRVLPAGRRPPQGDRPAGVAAAWDTFLGDAGWAGVLAEAFLADPRRPAFLVFRPGMELLPLLVEAIALLPPSRRWEVAFSTYFHAFPPGITCAWRGVLDGSPEAKDARRLPNALIVDLCRPLGRARGGALVHLARTGERQERSGADPLPPLTRTADRVLSADRAFSLAAGPPARHVGPPARTARPDSPGGSEVVPDPVVRIQAPRSLLSDGGPSRRRRSKALVAIITAACLAPLVAAVLLWSPSVRKRLGFEPEASRPIIEPIAVASRIEATPQAIQPETKKAEQAGAATEPAKKPEPQPLPVIKKAEGAVGQSVIEARRQAADSPKPVAEGPQPDQPIFLAFSLPDVPKSQLGARAPRRGGLDLPADANDCFELLNAPEFRLRQVPASAKLTWEIATQTGSGLGGGFPLARISRAGAKTWSFEWTKEAQNQARLVEALRDAVLKFETRDGRAILALLRRLEFDDRPLTIRDKQPLLFERMEPRTLLIPWTRNPNALAGTRWKLSIRRWRLVISRPGAEGQKPARRVIEPPPVDLGKEDGNGGVKLEQDLIPGEVTLRLAIDPTNPELIAVRIDPNRSKLIEGREDRAARLEELKKDTPRKDDRQRDPIEYRRGELRKLEGAAESNKDKIQTLKEEICELTKINAIRQIEDLLLKPSRTELSVVIGLDIGGATPLDIARIGFAD